MADQSINPQFIDPDGLADEPMSQPIRPVVRGATPASSANPLRQNVRPGERTLSFWETLDKPLLLFAGILVSVGIMMVFSTTFDWSMSQWKDPTVKVVEHLRNIGFGIVAATVAVLFGYRRLRRFAVPILLVAISFLLAVQFFGDDVFNARRTLIAGRFQPGEMAELSIIIYMAAWMGAKNARISSLTYGLIPFAVIVGLVVGLVVLQPDLSTALTILVVCGTMFFLAGADLLQLAAAAAIAFGGSVLLIGSGQFIYADRRIESFLSGIVNIQDAHTHIQQAYIAFANGGWTGLGLGQSLQKFSGLPAPHTDSIFAVIGEELGILGAAAVVLLYVLFVSRGFYIARRATDPFGAMLAAGLSLWVAAKALLNIAVMLALVPPTGVTLPFISFGGSSLVTLMVGVGLILSIHRVTLQKENAPERRIDAATGLNYSRRDRRARVPRASSS